MGGRGARVFCSLSGCACSSCEVTKGCCSTGTLAGDFGFGDGGAGRLGCALILSTFSSSTVSWDLAVLIVSEPAAFGALSLVAFA